MGHGTDGVRHGRRSFLAAVGGALTAGTGARRAVGSEESSVPEVRPTVGAGLNGRPRRLADDLHLLDASDTTWVRAFLDVREKAESDRRPARDPDVRALGRMARERDCRLIVSLKWDFAGVRGTKESIRVPRFGSDRETSLLQTATDYLRAIDAPVDAVVLGNEPLWETPVDDLRGDPPSVVRFTRTLRNHLAVNYEGTPALLVGAFNRLHEHRLRERQFPGFHRGMFELAREDDVAGVDLHLHFDRLTEAEAMLATARERVPDGTVTATEFSPVWRYDRYTDVPIGRFDAGEQFAREHGFPPEATPVDYFEVAKADPRPPAELVEFMSAMPWYNEDHVADVADLFADYGVAVGAVGFYQGEGMREEEWTGDWTPFHINFLFQRALLGDGDGAHPHYIGDYRRLATPTDYTFDARPTDPGGRRV